MIGDLCPMHSLLRAVILALVVLASPPAVAQQTAAPAAAAEQPAPQAIPVPQIITRVDADVARLREIAAALEPISAFDTVRTELTEVQAARDQLQADPRNERLAELSLRDLNDLQNSWSLPRERLEGWTAELAVRSVDLGELRLELQALRDAWTLTGEGAREAEVPQTILDRVATILGQIEAIGTVLDERLSDVVTLDGRVSAERLVLDEALGVLEQALGLRRGRLLAPDDEPLWISLQRDGPGIYFPGEFMSSLQSTRASIASFRQSHQDEIVLHLAVLVSLLFLLIYLGRRGRALMEREESLRPAAHILSRPLATMVLLGLMGSRLLYRDAPEVVFELLGLMFAVAVMRVLPGLVPDRLRRPILVLLALFILEIAGDLMLEDSLLHRLHRLLLASLILWGLFRVLRPGSPVQTASDSTAWTFALKIGRLGQITLFASIVANVVGLVSLGTILLTGVLGSAAKALALFTVLIVMDGLITLVLKTRPAQSLNAVRRHTRVLHDRAIWFLRRAALVIWAGFVLQDFQILEPLWGGIAGALGRPWVLGTLEINLGEVLTFVFSVWISVLVSRFVRFVLGEDVLPRLDLPRGIPSTISMVVHYSIIAIGFFVAMAAAGIELSRFTILVGALGVGIGFGMQNLVNNFISGLILIFERPIKVGDVVEIGALVGEVRQIGIRASTVRTFAGAEVIVPNGNLISNEVTNWTLSDRKRRIEICVGVAYGTDPERVLEILRKEAVAHEATLKEPAPVALFIGFGDSSLDFSLRFWTPSFDEWVQVSSDVSVRINRALAEAGIEIPFPQRDLHLRSVDPRAHLGALAATDESRHPSVAAQQEPTRPFASGRDEPAPTRPPEEGDGPS